MTASDNSQSKVIGSLVFNVDGIRESLSEINSSIKQFQDAAGQKVDMSATISQLQQVSTEVAKLRDQMSKPMSSNMYIQNEAGQLQTLRQAIDSITLSWKAGELEAEQYLQKLRDLKSVYANAFAPSNASAAASENALRASILQAESLISRQQDLQLQSERSAASSWQAIQQQNIDHSVAMDKAYYQALQEDGRRSTVAKQQEIDQQIKQTKLLVDTQILTASQGYTRLKALYDSDAAFFESDNNRKIQVLRQLSAYQDAQQKSMYSAGSVRQSLTGSSGFGAGTMIAGMVGFEALIGMYDAMVNGMKQVEAGSAGIQQVFEGQIKSQQQLNDVTNQAIGIAQHYGTQVGDVLDGLKLYGRQYKDVETALTLVNSATLLSVVDNVNLTDANRALEATMNSLGLAATDQASAYANSMRIVDSWSNLAHNASVSATSLMQAVEASGGAAHAVGVNFDQLNALATSAVKNTGMMGRLCPLRV